MPMYTHSTKQLDLYITICKRKGVLPIDVSEHSPKQLGDVIQSMFDMPTPATESQINMLRDMLQELVTASIPGVRMPSELFFKKLNQNNFQDWLEKTRNLRALHFDKLPANETQLERIVDMYLCPEIEWESISINKRETVESFDEDGIARKTNISYSETVTIQRKIYRNEETMEPTTETTSRWSYMTPEEFKQELTNKLTHQTASAILDQYTGIYQGWLRTRIKEGQKTQIKRLEERLANVFVPKEVTVFELDTPFEMEGELDTNVEIDTDAPFQVKSRKLDNWNPTSYVGLTPQQMNMLSREEADIYITQLRYELQDKELRDIGGAQTLSGDFEDMRTAKTIANARTKEYTELNNMLFGLSAIVGSSFETDSHNVDTLRHDALQTFFDTQKAGASDERKAELFVQIREFMIEAIRKNAINFKGLMNLADRSDVASELIDSIIADKNLAQELMKLQRKQH
jgi:hypothetical protein